MCGEAFAQLHTWSSHCRAQGTSPPKLSGLSAALQEEITQAGPQQEKLLSSKDSRSPPNPTPAQEVGRPEEVEKAQDFGALVWRA